jgi:2-oxo-4-hydroxy-4-carboxy-5-ureidoimidazoline decarboxylase
VNYGVDGSPAPPGEPLPPTRTIHATDLIPGVPAIGLDVVVGVLSDKNRSRISVETEIDERIDQPLLGVRPVAPGQYILRSAIGKHLAGDQSRPPNPPKGWLDIEPGQFDAAVDIGHLHFALLNTPYSYTINREG